MIFEEEVFGGSVPKNFFPSVEKGLRNAVQKGVLAGYPLVGLKAVLYDGSYHPVDSNDMAFQTAARLAYQDGIPKAKPTILEPIGLLKVTIPDANLGDIMSDISSKRRGTVLGMTAEDGMQTVEAEVPMAEMGSYTIDLRSMTQGRGSFSCKFVRYEEAPGNVQQKVIEEAIRKNRKEFVTAKEALHLASLSIRKRGIPMKNTNKNMMYTFWSGAILLCLALVAVVLVFTNAVGNTGSPKAEATPAVTETPTPTPQATRSRPSSRPLRSAQQMRRMRQHLCRPDLFPGRQVAEGAAVGVDAHRQGRRQAGLDTRHRCSARLLARHGEVQIPRDRQQCARG